MSGLTHDVSTLCALVAAVRHGRLPRKYVSAFDGTPASESLHIPHRTRRAGPEHAFARSSWVDASFISYQSSGAGVWRPHAHRPRRDFAIQT